MFDTLPDILSVKDLMSALNIGRNKAYDLLRHKEIESIRIGSTYRIPKIALIKFIHRTVSV